MSTTVKSYIHTTTPYPTTLTLSSTSIPSTPFPNHILVRIHAASINPVDIQLMNLPIYNLPYLSAPKLLARDFSGIVLASSSPNYRPNDLICGILPPSPLVSSGTLTEIAHIDLSTACIIPKPSHLSHKAAASLPLVYLTARTCIDRVTPTVTAGSKRLVVLGGSSSTGVYTIKLAVSRGWRVLASCSARNVEFVRGLGRAGEDRAGGDGMVEVVDYTSSKDAVVDAVRGFQAGAIVDCVGGTETVGMAGHYVSIVGDKTSRATMGGSAIYLTHPGMVLRWALGWMGWGKKYECIVLEGRKEWLEEVGGLREEDVVVDSVFPWERTKEAFERMDTGRCRGKVVIEVEEGDEIQVR